MAGRRSALVRDVMLAVLQHLASSSSIPFPPSNPNHGVDIAALLSEFGEQAPTRAPHPLADDNTIDLVDSPVRPSPTKLLSPRALSPPVLPEKRQRTPTKEPAEVIEIDPMTPVRTAPEPRIDVQKPIAKRRRGGSQKDVAPSRGAASRNLPSKQFLERFKRMSQHPIYLIKREACGRAFVVMGATGSVYHVELRKCTDANRAGTTEPVCTCLDFVKRNKGQSSAGRGPCKHLIFVLNKVLKVHHHDNVMYQVSLLDSEVDEIMRNAPSTTSPEVMADEAVQESFENSQEIGGNVEESCSICFDPVDPADVGEASAVYCASCRKGFHGACMAKFQSVQEGQSVNCPLCRSKWDGQGALNLAKYSSKHQHGITMAQLYPDSHQYIGSRGVRRGGHRRGGGGGGGSRR